MTAVSPSAVPIAGGSQVIIRGAGFTSGATVEFDGTPATAVVFDNATQIRATAPAHAAGAVDVVLRIGATSATMSKGISFGSAAVVGALGPLTRASVASNGSGLVQNATGALMSRNGRFVLFSHVDNGVVPGDANNLVDLFIRDLDQQTTEQVNIHESGSPGPGSSTAISAVAITPDGRYVAFVTGEALVTADTNGVADVYVRDRLGNTTTRASLTSTGSQISSASSAPAISADGRFVAFVVGGTGVVPADTVIVNDVFVRDMVANTTVMISLDPSGTAVQNSSASPSISDDGRFVAFHSFSPNLAPGMAAQNGQNDAENRDERVSARSRRR